LFLLFETQYVPNKLDILSVYDQTHKENEHVDVFQDDVRVTVVTVPHSAWKAGRTLPVGLRKPYVVVYMAPLDDYDNDPRMVVQPRQQPPRRQHENPLEALALARRSRKTEQQQAIATVVMGEKKDGDDRKNEDDDGSGSDTLSDGGHKKKKKRRPHSARHKKEHQRTPSGASPSESDSPGASPILTVATDKPGEPMSSDSTAESELGKVHKRHKHPHPERRRLITRPRAESDVLAIPEHATRSIPTHMSRPEPVIVIGNTASTTTTTTITANTSPSSTTAVILSDPETSPTKEERPASPQKAVVDPRGGPTVPYQNQLTNALADIAEAADLPVFTEAAQVVVYLNRLDVYWQKCRHSDIKCSFPEYTGGSDPRRALDFIISQFEAKFKAKERPYKHRVVSACTLDDEQMTSAVIPAILDAFRTSAK
jgi:hypothetical protein